MGNIRNIAMNFFSWIKSTYTPPSAERIALSELEDAKRQLLQVQSTQEYSAKMAEYYQGKIKRLTSYIKAAMKENDLAQNANQ